MSILDDVTERKEREHEQAFLAEAGRALASSLDYEETLEAVARLAVPRIADWCAVDVVENGAVQRLAVVHSEPEKEQLAHELARRWPPDPEASTGVPAVLRTGEPALYPTISDDLLRSVAADEEHYRMLHDVGLRSAIVVPMIARGRTLGAITLILAESGREYDNADLALAQEIASRAAFAMDNARLYQQATYARSEAEAAQRRAEEARREAESANRAKSDFLAMMSHEIRTPINAIIGYTDLLEMGIAGPLTERQHQHLARVKSSSQHLLMLIEDILDLAKVEAGRIEVARERVLVADAVAAAVGLTQPQAMENGIALENQCEADAGTACLGDEDRVRQILVNLLSNAVKFTHSGGRIRILCETRPDADPRAAVYSGGPWTCVRVEDTGIGIPAADLDTMFRPFVQAEAGLTRTRGGTGLGLSISRQLARLMGGDVTATSEPGVGSAFVVWLPSDEDARTPVHEVVMNEARTDTPPGIRRVGESMRANLASILDAFADRIAADPLIPMTATLNRGDLEDHASSLLADMAQALIVLKDSDYDAANLLRDGTEIQRVIAQLHGAQRARLGWSEDALRREFDVLREEIAASVEGSADAAVVEAALDLLLRFVDQARRISLQGLRRELGRNPDSGAPPT